MTSEVRRLVTKHAMRFTNAIGYHDSALPYKAKNTEWKAHLRMLDKTDPSYKT